MNAESFKLRVDAMVSTAVYCALLGGFSISVLLSSSPTRRQRYPYGWMPWCYMCLMVSVTVSNFYSLVVNGVCAYYAAHMVAYERLGLCSEFLLATARMRARAADVPQLAIPSLLLALGFKLYETWDQGVATLGAVALVLGSFSCAYAYNRLKELLPRAEDLPTDEESLDEEEQRDGDSTSSTESHSQSDPAGSPLGWRLLFNRLKGRLGVPAQPPAEDPPPRQSRARWEPVKAPAVGSS